MELSTKMRLLATQLESRLVSHTRYISPSPSLTSGRICSILPDLAPLFFPHRDPRRLPFLPLPPLPPNLFLELGIFGNLCSHLAGGIDFKLILIYWNARGAKVCEIVLPPQTFFSLFYRGSSVEYLINRRPSRSFKNDVWKIKRNIYSITQ